MGSGSWGFFRFVKGRREGFLYLAVFLAFFLYIKFSSVVWAPPSGGGFFFFSVINFYELKFMSIIASSFHGMLKQLINSGGGSGA